MIKYIKSDISLRSYDKKILVCLLLFMSIFLNYSKSLKIFLDAVGGKTNACLMPFYFSNNFFLAVYLFCIVYIQSDIPFFNKMSMYQMIRTGKYRWVAGKIIYIALRANIVNFLLYILSIVPLLSYVNLSGEWSNALKTIALTDVLSEYNLEFFIDYQLLLEYTPIQFCLIGFLIMGLISSFIGIFLFLLSLYINRETSLICTIVLSVFSYYVINMEPSKRYKLAKIIPPVWLKFANVKKPELGFYWLPSLNYMFKFLIAGIIIMSILLIIKIKKVEIGWMNED